MAARRGRTISSFGQLFGGPSGGSDAPAVIAAHVAISDALVHELAVADTALYDLAVSDAELYQLTVSDTGDPDG